MTIWPVQHAKARFSELLDACQREGPQVVSQGRLKVCHGSAGAAMLVPVLSGLLSSFGRPRCHC